MSTEFINDQWRLPNNENKDKQSNYSMDFDGSSQYITLGSISSINTGFTISGWVNTTNLTTSSGAFRGWFSSGTFNNANQFAINISTLSNYGGVGFINVWEGNSMKISGTSSVADGNWHHVVLTKTPTELKLYVNGSLQNTVSNSSTWTWNNVYIGIGNSNATFGTQGLFNGKIDAVAIFNYALSSSQITTLYGSSSTGIGNPMSLSPKPVAYYPLGDQDAFNGANYLVPNSSLKDYVFDFNNSQEINCGNDSSLQMDTVFTMSCWINTTSTSRGSIFGTYISNGYYIDLMASGTVQGGYHSTGSHFLRPSSSTVNDGKWHHICYVISGTATDGSDLNVYIDGQLNNGSFTSSGTPSGAITTNPFKINLQGYAGRYTGKTSNVQIFNSALSSTDVETLYNNGSPLTSMSGFTSLQGWWKLDASATYDGSNWTIEDSSSNSNTGTSTGMTQANLVQSDLSFTSGYSPYALDFDGANDYINLGTTPIVTGIFTFSLWIKRTSTSSGKASQVIIGKDGQSSNRVFNVFMSLSGVIGFWVSQTGGYVSTYRVNTSTLINDTNWHNLIVINNGDNNNNQVFIDGTEASYTLQGTGRTTLYNTTGIATSIGSSVNTPTTYGFNGSLSNLSIWNAALTPAQVTEIYSEGIPQNLNNHSAVSSLVSWWQLGSNSSFNTNWTVLDEKGSNNGTSSNMTEDDIVDGVGSYANGLSSGMGGDEVIGDAPYSTANSLSVNMDVLDRVEDTPA